MGARGNSPSVQVARGQAKSERAAMVVFINDEAQQDWTPPDWMDERTAALYERRVKRYHRGGQNIDGMQEQLAQYCRLETALIGRWQANEVPPMQWVDKFLKFSVEFYDTPASRKLPVSGKKADNRFGKHKRD